MSQDSESDAFLDFKLQKYFVLVMLFASKVVASGLLMPGGPGLKDPCEKGDVDVTTNMSVQQREDITHSAQRYLRLMHFRQIYKVLGMSEEDFFDEAHR